MNALSNANVSVLRNACTANSLETVDLLMSNGADPSVADEDGWTALMTAVFHEFEDVVPVLLEDKSLDLTKTNNRGVSALEMSGNNKVILDLISTEMQNRESAEREAIKLSPEDQAALDEVQNSFGIRGQDGNYEKITYQHDQNLRHTRAIDPKAINSLQEDASFLTKFEYGEAAALILATACVLKKIFCPSRSTSVRDASRVRSETDHSHVV